MKSLQFLRAYATIPGPKHYKLLGPLNDVFTFGRPEKLHLTMDDYHRKYGPIFQVKAGPSTLVFLSSGEFIRSMYAHEGKYPKHIVPPLWLYFNQKHKIERGLLFMDDEQWLRYRQPLNNYLLRDTQWFEGLIHETCEQFVSSTIGTSSTKQVDNNLEDEIYLWATNLTMNLMVGSMNFSHLQKTDANLCAGVTQFVNTSREVMSMTSKLASIPAPIADRLKMQVWRRYETATFRSIEMSNKFIDMLDRDVECSDAGLFRKLTKDGFSRDEISRIFIDLLIASVDTSANTALFLLHHIAKDTDLQENNLITFQTNDHHRLRNVAKTTDDVEFPLMRGALREILRLYPTATFITRILDVDAEFGNFIVPKGCAAVSSMYTAGRCPENYPDPLRFWPDRWLRNDSKAYTMVLKPQVFVPFAIGARSCVGQKVATFEISCLMSKILRNFTLESRNVFDVGMKIEMVPVPDQRISIDFTRI